MNELTDKRVMTTQELAAAFNVSEKTVIRAAENKGVDSTVAPFETNGGIQYKRVFNEQEATAIKQEIQSHHNLQSRQIDSVSTEVEENEIILQAQNILVNRIKELKDQLTEQAPKVDLYNKALDCKGSKSMGDVAKILNVGRNKLFAFLRNKNILMA